MKKQYTKRQITEAIAYWKKQLKMMNESHDYTINFHRECDDGVLSIKDVKTCKNDYDCIVDALKALFDFNSVLPLYRDELYDKIATIATQARLTCNSTYISICVGRKIKNHKPIDFIYIIDPNELSRALKIK